jgi:hypothetical protein
MCGEAGATTKVPNPNEQPMKGENDIWDVCDECKHFIEDSKAVMFEVTALRMQGKEPDIAHILAKHGFESSAKPTREALKKVMVNDKCRWYYECNQTNSGAHVKEGGKRVCECALATLKLQQAGINMRVVMDGHSNNNCRGNIEACHVIERGQKP